MAEQLLQNKPSTLAKATAVLGAVLAWSAVILQLILMLQNRTAPVAETIIRFFSFFTILTNTWVAICFTNLSTATERRFSFSTLSATVVYILVVGLVYNLVLRSTWNPQGLQRLVDEALHTVIPILYTVYWWAFLRRGHLPWKVAISWLVYPFLYLVFILLRGAASGFYPYPFVNVTALGYEKVLLNSAVLLVVFLMLNLIVVGISRGRKNKLLCTKY